MPKIDHVSGTLYVPQTYKEEMQRWGYIKDLLAAKSAITCPQQKLLHDKCITEYLQAQAPDVLRGHMETWLTNHVFEKYTDALADKEQESSKVLLNKLSPLDHICSVLHVIKLGQANTNARLDRLATAFFDACQRLGPNELLLLQRQEDDTLQDIAGRVLGINMNDPRYIDRHRVYVVLIRLGQF